MAVNFGVQVVIVRALTQSDYGAFSYALSLVAIVQSLSTLGLHRAAGRFVALYHERGDRGRVLAIMIFIPVIVTLIASVLIIVVYAWTSGAAAETGSTTLEPLLLILAALAPIQALDHQCFESIYASFGSVRSIFVRRYLFGPVLQVGVVVFFLVEGSSVLALSVGYLAAAAAGLMINVPLLVSLLRRHGLLEGVSREALTFPVREVAGFALPLFSTDVLNVTRSSLDAVFVEHYRGPEDVAILRAVQPIARLNEVVYTTFALLFLPMATRLLERADRTGAEQLYWRTALWQAVLAFPVFVATFANAQPLVTLLFGQRYAASAVVLAVLAVGHWVNAAFGQNSLLLIALGRLRYVVVGNLVAAVVAVALSLLLVPQMGPFGAALSTTAAYVAHNGFNQVGLLRAGVRSIPSPYLRVYAMMAGAAAVVTIVQAFANVGIAVGLALAAVAGVAVVRVAAPLLDAPATFPEILRIPLAKRLLGC